MRKREKFKHQMSWKTYKTLAKSKKELYVFRMAQYIVLTLYTKEDHGESTKRLYWLKH